MSHDAVSSRTGEPMRCPTCGTRLVEYGRRKRRKRSFLEDLLDFD